MKTAQLIDRAWRSLLWALIGLKMGLLATFFGFFMWNDTPLWLHCFCSFVALCGLLAIANWIVAIERLAAHTAIR